MTPSSRSSSSSSDASFGPLNPHADTEWQDAEPDEEFLEVVSLFDDAVFPGAEAMLEHCKITYNFSLVMVVRELGGRVFRLS